MENTYALIKAECLKSVSKNPVALAKSIMKMDFIKIHGPEHHILDGSCFLTAMHNAGVDFDLSSALDEMAERGRLMPGATCGKWGMCGSASSVSAALAIIHGTGPLSDNQFYKDNLALTSRALEKISEIGGPRCCKRNAFLSISTAVDFVNERYGIELEKDFMLCEFSGRNSQCIKAKCPFYAGK